MATARLPDWSMGHDELVRRGLLHLVGYVCSKCGFIQERMEHVDETPPPPMCPACGKDVPDRAPHTVMEKAVLEKSVKVKKV